MIEMLVAASLLLPAHAPVPGGVAVIALGAHAQPPVVEYRNRRVLAVEGDEGWVAVVGIPLSAEPGAHELRVGGNTLVFDIDDKAYETQRLTIANERMVNPLPEDIARINAERPRLQRARATFSPHAPSSFRLAPPAEGRRSSAFGLRRVLNDQPRGPHSGIDIAAPTGSQIQAPAPGTVIETGEFYYTGNTVFVDHGRGFVTAYYHMDSVGVAPGDTVNTGDLLGTIGETGRVTGPHLHFVVLLNGEMVDPDLFLQ
ncbi:MAG: peptidoglycan DD-metalloendopeptidase family protein [Gammaproteobacteria bacterium]